MRVMIWHMQMLATHSSNSELDFFSFFCLDDDNLSFVRKAFVKQTGVIFPSLSSLFRAII